MDLYLLYSRLWGEIRKKAKLQIFTLLLRIKVIFEKEDETQSLDNASPKNAPYLQPATQEILTRLQIVVDVFIENGLI